MIRVLVIQLSGEGIRQVRRALTGTTGVLVESLPSRSGLWRVPESGEAAARRDLSGIAEVARGIRLAESVAVRAGPPALLRPWLARQLFDAWNSTTNPELLAAQWNSLGPEDRRFWSDRAQQYLTIAADGKQV